MADNQRTYKATIDVDTKGTDQLAKLNKNLDDTLEGFEDIGAVIEKTRKALQKAKLDGDKVEFKRLRKELNNLERQLEDTEITSRRFSDALAEQPGVVGLVGQSLKGLDGGLKVLAANPIIAVVTLLAGLFITLKESLEKTERGQALLNKASEAFGKVLGPVFAIIEAVAFPIFEAFISYIEFVAEGFNKFAKFLGIGTQQIEEASRASSEVLQQKYEEEQARQEEETKKLEEETKKRIELEKQEAEKRAEARKKLLEESDKIIREAELALMDDRARELLLREEEYQEELKTLKAAGVTDLTAFETQYRQDLLEINKTYDDKELAQEKEKQDKIKAEQEKAAAEEKQRLADIASAESKKRQDELAFLQADFNLRKELGAISFQSELDLFQKQRDLQREELVANKASNEALLAFDKETSAARIQIETQQQQAKLAIISDALGTLAQAVGENTVAGKALAIAQATINTYQGATMALATYPPPFGAIAAATVIAAGLLNVKKIISTKVPAPPGTNVAGGGGGATPPQPSASIAPPQIQGLQAGGGNTGTQIAETIAESQSRPIRAYVVSQDISSKQAMDRRVNTAASL